MRWGFLFAFLVGFVSPSWADEAWADEARADEVFGDVSPAELKAQLEGWGYQVFAHEDEQDRPQLLVSVANDLGGPERKGFAMRLNACTPEDAMFMQKRCEGFEFRAYVKPGFPIKEKVFAAWNREFGHTRAFVKEDVPRLAWRINVSGGVTWPNIRASVDIWRKELTAYIDHLDASVMD